MLDGQPASIANRRDLELDARRLFGRRLRLVDDVEGSDKTYMTSIIEFRNGEIAKQTDYFASPFEAPAWRSQWVERMENV